MAGLCVEEQRDWSISVVPVVIVLYMVDIFASKYLQVNMALFTVFIMLYFIQSGFGYKCLLN